jgi:hypothetical protein
MQPFCVDLWVIYYNRSSYCYPATLQDLVEMKGVAKRDHCVCEYYIHICFIGECINSFLSQKQ